MQLGIVGLPNVGKSTLFNALTEAGAECANYPFCTIEPNVGVVPVPDDRLAALARLFNPKKITPAFIEFVDIAGLVKGASQGEGLGNKFLAHIREVDAVVHVVRCFESAAITHVDGGVDPLRDIETINTELILADLEILEKRLERVRTMLKSGDKKFQTELENYETIRDGLNRGIPLRNMTLSDEQKLLLGDLGLITSKPVIYAANLSETDLRSGNRHFEKVKGMAAAEGSETLPICAKIEAEIAALAAEDKKMFLQDLGLTQSGLERLIQTGYQLLGLISYLTAGPQEVRAWTIPSGTKAPQAAGKIHSDFERGFIRAEIISFADLINCGSMVQAREQGLVRSEGKDYMMRDGDVTLFRFNV